MEKFLLSLHQVGNLPVPGSATLKHKSPTYYKSLFIFPIYVGRVGGKKMLVELSDVWVSLQLANLLMVANYKLTTYTEVPFLDVSEGGILL